MKMTDEKYLRLLRKRCPMVLINDDAYRIAFAQFNRNEVEFQSIPLEYHDSYIRMRFIEYAEHNKLLIEFALI